MRSTLHRASLSLTVLIALASCGTNTQQVPAASPAPTPPPGPVTSNSAASPLNWTAAPSLSAPRSQAAAVNLTDGSVLVLGGSSATAPTSVLKLTPGATAWTMVGNLDHIRVAPGAGLLGTGLIAVYGGSDKKVDKSSTGYDPTANRTSSLPAMGTPRTQHAFASGFGTVYAIGGRDDLGNVLASVESFAGSRWVTQASLPEARLGAAATVAGQDLYVIGGSNGTAPVNSVQMYNTVTNSWSLEAPLPVATSAASAVIDPAGHIMVIGGTNAANANQAAVWQSPQSGAAPIITSTPPLTVVVNQPYSYLITASGQPAPTFSLVSGPAGMTVDAASGLVSWTPSVNQFGPQTVALRASSIEGTANQSFTIDVAAPPPSVPTGLVASDVTETSVTLSWNPSTALIGSVSYVVYDRTGPCTRSGCRITAVAQGGATTATVTGLTAGSAHGFYAVAASSAGSVSTASTLLSVTTLQPAPPTNLVVTNTTQVSVSLFWTASVGPVPIVGYRVYDIDVASAVTTLRVDGIAGTSATVTNLLPNSRHLLRVVAYDASFNLSPVLAGNQVDVTTNSLPSIFHTPAFLNPVGSQAFPEQIVGVIGESLMVISGAAHTTAGVNYVLSTAGLPKPTLSVLSGPAGMSVDSVTGVVSWNPVNAAPGNYTATIRGTNTEGTTDFSFDYTVYPAGTDLLSPTGVLSSGITDITSTTALVTWSPATDNQAVSGYDIFAQTPPPGGRPARVPGPLVKVGTTSGTSLTINNLTPGTAYAIYVQAFDAAGNTGATGPSYISTLP